MKTSLQNLKKKVMNFWLIFLWTLSIPNSISTTNTTIEVQNQDLKLGEELEVSIQNSPKVAPKFLQNFPKIHPKLPQYFRLYLHSKLIFTSQLESSTQCL